jgi:CubicO group peptidase (beta-lactamase class C family)
MKFPRSILIIAVSAGLLAMPGLGAKPADPKAQLKGVSEFIGKAMAEWKVPGLAIAVVKDGRVILVEGYGLKDVKNNLKVTPRTVFAIGSTSKAFTAAAMGILVDEGKVDWDKPVREYLPTFRLWDPFATTRMTPRDLLCHRSGLPRHDLVWYGTPFSRRELVDRLAYLEPSHDFRTVFQYSNLMFMTAGHLIGALSGSTWEDFIRRRLFEPVVMTGSSFSAEGLDSAADHALGYVEKKGQVVEMPYKSIDAIGPAGSINSNALDMANWVMLNLDKGRFGGKTIISETVMNQVHSPQMVIQDPAFQAIESFPEMFYHSYGMGWAITSYRGHTMLHHNGNIDGFESLVSFMPRDNIGLVVLTNINGTALDYVVMFNIYDRLLGLDQVGWNQRFRELVDKRKGEAEKAQQAAGEDRPPGPPPSHPLEDFVGDYVHPGYGTLSVVTEGGSLKLTYNSLDFLLSHVRYDIYELKYTQEPDAPGIKGIFRMDAKGNIATIALPLEPAVKDIVFVRDTEKKTPEGTSPAKKK